MLAEAPVSDKRFRVILAVFLIWASVIAVRLFYFSIINREAAFQKMEIESLEKGKIRAMRGRLLSHDGIVLASSRRVYNLCLNTDIDSSRLNSLVEILDKELKIMRRQVMMKLVNAESQKFVILKRDLETHEIENISRLFNRNKVLFLKMIFIRDTVKDSKVGNVMEDEDGLITGVTGFEKKYDKLLQGQDLVYEVMIDKQNKVIEKTFNELSKMIKGQDVYLSKEEWP